VSEPAASVSLFHTSRRPFLLRKVHSLTGVAPVGLFLVFHLWTNAKAMQGQQRFDDAVGDISHMPYLVLMEAGILLPLLFHAGYGVKLALDGRHNVGRYGYSRNWMYTMQRVTGLLAFAFICFHLYEYWAQKVLGRMESQDFYPALCASMSSTVSGIPVIALVYVLGIAASTFHFANGLWGFCFSWGITVSRRSQRLSATVFGLVGLAVFLLGANTAIYFATGSRFPGMLLGSSRAPAAGHAGGAARTCADVAIKVASTDRSPASAAR
jgi:succinate dehydrogenase/fumarate reductase cytochrome b subunit (b558 family)